MELTEGDNYYQVTVTSESKEATQEYTLKISVPVSIPTMDSSTALSIGDAVTATDGSKWHVLEASEAGTETVVLLSDYNLNSDGTYNTSCGKNINSTYTCSVRAFDSDGSQAYSETDSNNIGYFIKNTYEPLVTGTLPGTTNVTLPTAYQIAAIERKTINVDGPNNYKFSTSWLYTTNFWTKTRRTDKNFGVFALGWSSNRFYMGPTRAEVSNEKGARPVITTPKTNLLKEGVSYE